VPSRTTLALLLTALLCGCGGGGDKPGGTPQAAATAAFAHPHIISPGNGASVPATADLGTSRGAKIQVTGTAEPNTEVTVGADCQLNGCETTVRTDPDGHFKAPVSASTTAANHAVTITVAYQVSDAVDSDRVIVTIGAQKDLPSAPKKTHKKAASRPRRSSATPFPAITAVPPASTPIPQTTVPPTTGSGKSGTVVVIGDSLAQGMQPYLAGALPGWKVSVNARIGRPLAEGMGIYHQTTPAAGTVYAFSLFTNDDPRSTAALTAAVQDSVSGGRCAVWSTIVRPPVNGVSYDAANQKLRALASQLGGRLQLVDWASEVAANPSWVPGSDGVHSNAVGYQNRARLYAQKIQACNP
jgi:hypothetical protein